jgi:hypothetical protein
LGVGLTTLPVKKKIVEKPPRNSAGFCGGGQGLSWAVEPRKEDDLPLCLQYYLFTLDIPTKNSNAFLSSTITIQMRTVVHVSRIGEVHAIF